MYHAMMVYIVVAYIGQAGTEEYDWCGYKCGKRVSTMCEYDHQTFTDQCGDFKHEMTPTKRKHLLHMHNDYRNKIADGRKNRSWPKAANMRQLGWDVVLEAVAMRWAEQCIDENDKCPLTPDFWYVGQNVAIFSSNGGQPDANGSDAFRAWAREIQNVGVKPSTIVRNFDGAFDYGHLTQIIWAATHKLGCAKISYQKDDWYHSYMFCNYGLGGNLMGSPIYKMGTTCSECPKGTKCNVNSRYPHLCALPDDVMQPEDIEGPSRQLIESGTYVSIDIAPKSSPTAVLVFTAILLTLVMTSPETLTMPLATH